MVVHLLQSFWKQNLFLEKCVFKEIYIIWRKNVFIWKKKVYIQKIFYLKKLF